MDNPEPEENLSGDTEVVREGLFSTGDARTAAETVIDRLGDRYWRKRYGGKPAFACLVRTILSQNTSDKASQPAYDAILERFDDAEDFAVAIADADRTEIAKAIEPAGLYDQKSRVLQRAAERVIKGWGGADAFDRFVKQGEPDTVRTVLLSFHGVGPKTADCVLLFAGGTDGVFPVDTHVYRIARRLGIAPPDADHESVRAHLEQAVPPEKCGFGHTSMIQFGREVCTAGHPACLDDEDACPMFDLCDRVGVDLTDQTVVDPAKAPTLDD